MAKRAALVNLRILKLRTLLQHSNGRARSAVNHYKAGRAAQVYLCELLTGTLLRPSGYSRVVITELFKFTELLFPSFYFRAVIPKLFYIAAIYELFMIELLFPKC
jgi:hypothetical protein